MNEQPKRKTEWTIWAGLALTAFVIFAAWLSAALKAKPVPVYGTIPDFTLTNQNGNAVSLADLRGHIWIADVIFTRCPGQCPQMTAHMTELEHTLAPGSVTFVTFTTDPAFDQPAVMKKYADRFDAIDSRWFFLTGAKSELHKVEVDGLRLAVLDKPAGEQEGANDLFIHSSKFVLIDRQGQIRGYFDGEKPTAVREVALAAQNLASQ